LDNQSPHLRGLHAEKEKLHHQDLQVYTELAQASLKATDSSGGLEVPDYSVSLSL